MECNRTHMLVRLFQALILGLICFLGEGRESHADIIGGQYGGTNLPCYQIGDIMSEVEGVNELGGIYTIRHIYLGGCTYQITYHETFGNGSFIAGTASGGCDCGALMKPYDVVLHPHVSFELEPHPDSLLLATEIHLNSFEVWELVDTGNFVFGEDIPIEAGDLIRLDGGLIREGRNYLVVGFNEFDDANTSLSLTRRNGRIEVLKSFASWGVVDSTSIQRWIITYLAEGVTAAYIQRVDKSGSIVQGRSDLRSDDDDECKATCNLVENGDFSMGDTLFTTEFPNKCGLCESGGYCVGPSFRTKCSTWPDINDHTVGDATGSFLIIDGAAFEPPTPAVLWSRQGIPVTAGLPYTFSFWGRNIFATAGSAVDVEMRVQGTSFGTLSLNTVSVASNTAWVEYTATWTPTTSEVVTIDLRQMSQGSHRDFGIDDIFFGTCPCPCEPAPEPRCDSMTIAPHSYGPLDLAGRTFTVHNLKVPASPIASVTVSLSPDPFPPAGNAGYHWNGGDVVVDFPNSGFSRDWTTTNSGSAWYSEIDMNCTGSSGAPQGPAAETSVQFNIGVIQTLNWAGTVTVTATHCDGEVCTSTFEWCAKPNQIDCPSPIATEVNGSVFATQPKLASTTLVVEGTANDAIKYVMITMFDINTDTSNRIFAIGAHESGSTASDMKGMAYIGGAVIFSGDSAQRYAARVDLVHGLPRGHKVEIPIVVDVRIDTPMTVLVQYYDDRARLIDSDTIGLSISGTTAVDDPTTGIRTHGIDATLDNPEPSPTAGMVRLGYRLASAQRIRLELYDVTGNRIAAIEEGRRGAGRYEILYDAGALANGTYMVVLTTESGDVISRPIILQH